MIVAPLEPVINPDASIVLAVMIHLLVLLPNAVPAVFERGYAPLLFAVKFVVVNAVAFTVLETNNPELFASVEDARFAEVET